MSLSIDDLKKLGEDTFTKLKLEVETLLASSEQIVVSTGTDYLLHAQSRFTQTMSIIVSGEFTGKDAVQFFLNRMDDEKNILKGMFFYLETVGKDKIETLSNSIQFVLLKAATDFLNSVQL